MIAACWVTSACCQQRPPPAIKQHKEAADGHACTALPQCLSTPDLAMTLAFVSASTVLNTATPSDTHLVLLRHHIPLMHNFLGQLQLVLAPQLAHGLRFEAPVARQQGHKGPTLELEEGSSH